MGEDGKHHADYSSFQTTDRKKALEQLLISYEALAEGQDNWVCNLANAASLIWHCYISLNVDVNWAGFYLTRRENKKELILGPFQGKVACQLIQFGKGVCGTAASSQQSQLVPDVENFPGHIACDGETKSEIVVPIVQNGETVGVIDIDCLDYNGFTKLDQEFLEKLAASVSKTCVF